MERTNKCRDEADNAIETHEHKGDFKEWWRSSNRLVLIETQAGKRPFIDNWRRIDYRI
jgi:hypothetical protein